MSFAPQPNRDASDTIRGYVYQAVLTARRWLDLGEGQALVLECGEDIDRVTEAIRTSTQVKATNGQISLTSLKSSLVNAVATRLQNPSQDLRFEYFTTSPVGPERNDPFAPETGIALWCRLHGALSTDSATAYAADLVRLASFLRKMKKTKGIPNAAWDSFRGFIASVTPAELLDHVRRFEILPDQLELDALVADLEARLVVLGLASEAEAPAARQRLFYRVAFKLTESGEKRLDLADLTQAITQDPTEDERSRLARLITGMDRLDANVRLLLEGQTLLIAEQARQGETLDILLAADTLARWWNRRRAATNPNLDADLVLAGRERDLDKFTDWLKGSSSFHPLRADTADEVIAFVAAAAERLASSSEVPPISLDTILLLTDPTTALGLAERAPTALLLAVGPDVEGALVGTPHRIVAARDRSDQQAETLELGRIRTNPAADLLRTRELSYNVARNIARALNAGIGVFARRYKRGPAETPVWAGGTRAAEIVPYALAGAWSDSHPEDWHVLARIAGTTPEVVRVTAEQLLAQPGSPLRRIGDLWLLNDRADLWDLIAGSFSALLLERFVIEVRAILVEGEERIAQRTSMFDVDALLRAFRGEPPAGPSGTLRRAAAESFAMMGTRDLARRGRAVVDRAVRELLAGANEDRWRILAGHLEWLAEASPSAFLEALERDLASDAPQVLALYVKEDSPLFGRSQHHLLLWALERLAWLRDSTTGAVAVLARLVELGFGSRSGNSPLGSLAAVFSSWSPQTEVNRAERMTMLETLCRRFPQAGWWLIVSLIPKERDTMSPSSYPRYHDVALPDRAETYGEIAGFVGELYDLLIREAGDDPTRWIEIVSRAQGLAVCADDLIEQLNALGPRLSEQERYPLWLELRHLVIRHRKYADTDWSLPLPITERLESALPALAPSDQLLEEILLFQPRAEFLWDEDRRAFRAIEAERTRRRDEAVRSWLARGVETLIRAIELAESPEGIGMTLVRIVTPEEERSLLIDLFSGRDVHVLAAAAQVAWTRSRNLGDEWSRSWIEDGLEGFSSEGRTVFWKALASTPLVWDAVEASGEDVAYWTNAPSPWWQEPTAQKAERYVRLLMRHRNFRTAIRFVGDLFSAKTLPITSELALDLLFAAATQEWSGGENDQPVEEVARILKLARHDADAPRERVMQLEWIYLLWLEYSRADLLLVEEVARDPELFVSFIRMQKEDPDEANLRRADILLERPQVPIGSVDGRWDRETLHAYVDRALELAGTELRPRTLSALGRALAFSPVNEGDMWPPIPVRHLIEDLADQEFGEGLRSGRKYPRGMMAKIDSGGAEERAIATVYLASAQALAIEFPQTAKLLRILAQSYQRDADDSALNAELRDREG